ncbi:hypothetical protein [Parafrankia soli]|uniref:hypothetical protein n=1 Tax=Parafrankia soli TaxID=2599596 RepID=UPI000AB5314D|nr:hypothetical protein [Parafrankia soli]
MPSHGPGDDGVSPVPEPPAGPLSSRDDAQTAADIEDELDSTQILRPDGARTGLSLSAPPPGGSGWTGPPPGPPVPPRGPVSFGGGPAPGGFPGLRPGPHTGPQPPAQGGPGGPGWPPAGTGPGTVYPPHPGDRGFPPPPPVPPGQGGPPRGPGSPGPAVPPGQFGPPAPHALYGQPPPGQSLPPGQAPYGQPLPPGQIPPGQPGQPPYGQSPYGQVPDGRHLYRQPAPYGPPGRPGPDLPPIPPGQGNPPGTPFPPGPAGAPTGWAGSPGGPGAAEDPGPAASPTPAEAQVKPPDDELTYRLAPPGPPPAVPDRADSPAGDGPGLTAAADADAGRAESTRHEPATHASDRGNHEDRSSEFPALTGPHPLPPPPRESFTMRRPMLPPPGRITDGPVWPVPPPSYLDSPSGGGLLPAIPPDITMTRDGAAGDPPPGSRRSPESEFSSEYPAGSDFSAGSGYPAGSEYPSGSGLPPAGDGGQVPEPAGRPSRSVIIIAAVAAVIVIGAVIGIVLATRGDDSAETTATSIPPAAAGVPTDIPGEAPAGQQPTPQTSSPEDTLRSLLNPVTMTGCETPPVSDGAYADATLQCVGAEGVTVTAYHFPDHSALDRQIGARETYYTDVGNCDDGQQSSEEWNSPLEPNGGSRLCYLFAQRFITFWTIDDDLVAFSASDSDPKRLVTWWQTFDPIRR